MTATVRINLRLPTDLHAQLKVRADSDRRSLNAEVIWLLEGAITTEEER